MIAPCSHIFCEECIQDVINHSTPAHCPLCRAVIQKKDLRKALDYDNENKNEEDGTEGEVGFSISSSKINAVMNEMIRYEIYILREELLILNKIQD